MDGMIQFNRIGTFRPSAESGDSGRALVLLFRYVLDASPLGYRTRLISAHASGSIPAALIAGDVSTGESQWP